MKTDIKNTLDKTARELKELNTLCYFMQLSKEVEYQEKEIFSLIGSKVLELSQELELIDQES